MMTAAVTAALLELEAEIHLDGWDLRHTIHVLDAGPPVRTQLMDTLSDLWMDRPRPYRAMDYFADRMRRDPAPIPASWLGCVFAFEGWGLQSGPELIEAELMFAAERRELNTHPFRVECRLLFAMTSDRELFIVERKRRQEPEVIIGHNGGAGKESHSGEVIKSLRHLTMMMARVQKVSQ